MNLFSRRDFLGGVVATGAVSGCNGIPYISRSRSWCLPNLRFGVLADVHVRAAPEGNGCAEGFGTESLVRALEWFDARQADAVVMAGDLADTGKPLEWQAVADAWEWVFPGGRSRDGRPVERLFICGNHDNDGSARTNVKDAWERIFKEEFAPISARTVLGYHFVLAHWMPGTDGVSGVMGFYARNRCLFDQAKPFFHIQHPPPRGTCHGSPEDGQADCETKRILSAFPNAVAISGHSHYSMTDERAIWQEDFTSIGVGPLRRIAVRPDAHAPLGFENTRARNASHDIFDPIKLLPELDLSGCAQGMLIDVYDDRLEIARQEFLSGLSLGPDWTVPLPAKPGGPLSMAAREESLPVPEFPPEAALQARPVWAVNRARQRERAIEVHVPLADAVHEARCHEMEFVIESDEFVRKSKFVLMPDHHLPQGRLSSAKGVVCRFSIRDLPIGRSKLRFAVYPRNCLGRSGKPLTASFG